jgi:hypothetical protein
MFMYQSKASIIDGFGSTDSSFRVTPVVHDHTYTLSGGLKADARALISPSIRRSSSERRYRREVLASTISLRTDLSPWFSAIVFLTYYCFEQAGRAISIALHKRIVEFQPYPVFNLEC